MYLSETEEIIALIVCIAIVIGFAVSTYLEIKNTISEEKNKQNLMNFINVLGELENVSGLFTSPN